MANNNIYNEHTGLLDVVILDNPAKGIQYRLTISEFRDSMYIGVREWYASFDNSYAPTNNGFSMPYNLHSTSALFLALSSLMSKAEVKDEVLANLAKIAASKSAVADAISLQTAIPAELLAGLIDSIQTDQTKNEIVVTIKLKEGSSWLT